MITATWNWLWEKHDQVKDMFRFFIKPGEMVERKSGISRMMGLEETIVMEMTMEIRRNVLILLYNALVLLPAHYYF